MAATNKATSARSTLRSLDAIVGEWVQRSGSDTSLRDIQNLLEFLGKELFGDYEPYSELPIFRERLAAWIQNVDVDEDQQTLLRFVPWLLFFGREEMKTLYRAAFSGPIARWIIEQADLSLSKPTLQEDFKAAVSDTWFGSLAGMDLGSFMRVNGIDEQSLRPEFRVLSHLGDSARLQEYLKGSQHRENGYRRIVIVEDVVGSGRQMKDAIRIIEELENVSVLICPIIAAAKGCERGNEIARKSSGRIHFEPYFKTPIAATLSPAKSDHEDPVFDLMRTLITSTWERLKLPFNYDSPFGFGDLGLLVLTHLNCPNNVPPIFHRFVSPNETHQGWTPLFPRVVRES